MDLSPFITSASQIVSGQLAPARGGSGTDLSATGGTSQFLKQVTVGGAFSVAQITDADLTAASHVLLSNVAAQAITFTDASSSGTAKGLQLTPTYSQTSTAGSSDLTIARTETALGSGPHYFLNCLAGATGTTQKAYIDSNGSFYNFSAVNSPVFRSAANDVSIAVQNRNFTGAGDMVDIATGTFTNSTGTAVGVAVKPTYNQTSTAGATDLLINRTETAVGSGSQLLADFQVGGLSKFNLGRTGQAYFASSVTASNFSWGAGTLTIQSNGLASSGDMVDMATGTFTNSSGLGVGVAIKPTINQTGTSNWTALLVNPTVTASGSGGNLNIADFQQGGTSYLRVTTGGVNTNGVSSQATDVALSLQNRGFTGTNVAVNACTGNYTASANTQNPFAIQPVYNQTLTAGATDFLVNRTETAIGSGTHKLADFQVGGVSKASINRTGVVKPLSTTVSSLPTPATALQWGQAFATNGRKSGEAASAGTGIPVWCDGTNWRTYYDNSIAAA